LLLVHLYFRKQNQPGTISGTPPKPPAVGNCTIFSNVTGNSTRDGAVSGRAVVAPVHLWPSWPASSPWVTAVGATRFIGNHTQGEETASDSFGSGGGFSWDFNRSDALWQQDAVSGYLESQAKRLPPAGSYGRGTPDMAALGEAYDVVVGRRWNPVSGTSASTPAFAGLASLLNEARAQRGMPRMGFLNPWIYQHTEAFRDVTKGSSKFDREAAPVQFGYECAPGWDPVMGVGTPNFPKMLAAVTRDT